ncbi:MAG: hypothetical protein KKB21_00355 [Nanoarchaeota archaeon]|nr:hypothetical protein [Nanoarchaeota archaeon]MBU4086007.1 hypothetical protein [Nanoarchaeota archaeon]
MTVKEMKALSMAEASQHIENEELNAFIKKFSKTKESDAEKLRAEIEKLGNIKVKEEDIAKIIDILPEDAQDLAKVFTDVILDEKETSQIIEIVKKYK